MRRAVRHLGLIVAVAVLGTAAAGANALAGGSDGSWEVGAYGHEIFPDTQTGVQNSVGYGVRAGYFLKPTSEIELTWDTAKGDALVGPGPTYEFKKLGLMYALNFIPKGKKTAVPILSFGLGNMSVDNGSSSETSFYLQVGGGVRFTVSKHVAIRLDAGILRSQGQGEVIPHAADYNFIANIGVSFMFGGKGSGGADSTGGKKEPKDTKDTTKEGQSAPKGEKGEIP